MRFSRRALLLLALGFVWAAPSAALGPFPLGSVTLRVETGEPHGPGLIRDARILDRTGTLLREERYEAPGVLLRPFVWNVAGIDALVMDAEAFPTPRGGNRRLDYWVWESDFCPVGRKKTAQTSPSAGRLSRAASLSIEDGTLLERPADAPSDPLRGDRATAAAWDPQGRLYLKIPLRLRLCAPEGERIAASVEAQTPQGPWAVDCAPHATDAAARASSVLLYDAPQGEEGAPTAISPATVLRLGRAYLDQPPLTVSGNEYAVRARYARVEVFLDGRRGFVAAGDAGRLGLVSAP